MGVDLRRLHPGGFHVLVFPAIGHDLGTNIKGRKEGSDNIKNAYRMHDV